MLYHSRSFHKESFNDNHYLWKNQLFLINADQVFIKMSIDQTYQEVTDRPFFWPDKIYLNINICDLLWQLMLLF